MLIVQAMTVLRPPPQMLADPEAAPWTAGRPDTSKKRARSCRDLIAEEARGTRSD
jgi:hypothetical protein